MKIRNDYVTNSSSTSFIFGTPGCVTESIETVYRLIRIIVNEILSFRNEVIKRYEGMESSGMSQSDCEHKLIDVYWKLLNRSLLTCSYMDYEELTRFCLNTYEYEMSTYTNIMENECYSFNTDLIIVDVQRDNLKYLDGLRGSYFYNITELEDSFYEKYLNITKKEQEREELYMYDLDEYIKDDRVFMFENMGNICVSFEEGTHIELFSDTLDSFANYSYNL